MVRPLGVLLLSVAPLFLPIPTGLYAQTPAKSPFRLEVLHTQYTHATGMLEFQLLNNGTSEINAYEVSISVFVDGKEQNSSAPSGLSEDLLGEELLLQCGIDGSVAPQPAEGAWKGSFKPGETYVKSMPVSVDKSKLNGATPEVRVRVTGVIWSDGTIEGSTPTPMSPLGLPDMKRIRVFRQQEADEETKVLAIVNAHPEDPDIQHRIAEAIQNLKPLKDGYPREEQLPEAPPGTMQHVATPPVVDGVLGNLQAVSLSPYPKEIFEMFDKLWGCEHERRVSFLQLHPATATKSTELKTAE